MKHKSKRSPFLRLFLCLFALVLAAAAAAIGLYYYVFSIPEPEGLSLASWPHTFTDNFSLWMEYEGGALKIEQIGLERLDAYGLWLQVIDEAGQEIFTHNKPAAYPTSYAASELTALGTSAYENGYTVFVNSFESSGRTWSYLVGFPYAVGKYMLYYNGETVPRLLPVFRAIIQSVFCAIVLSFLICVFWLAHHLEKITRGVERISRRAYQPLKEKGMYSGVYKALNEMDEELRRGDQLAADTERARREWIANITHDLKTPLSPIKGYAELLAEAPAPDSATVQEYGSIIRRNADHAEKLVNDLKLTYQLDAGAIPLLPQKVRLTRFLKELVIDFANDPAYAGRTIVFESSLPELTAVIDPGLIRRAVQNLIINALVHNPPETVVTISVVPEEKRGVSIIIQDNGVGMRDVELNRLWNRYYRGTNTTEKPEGSGLGLAIAKQIILLHGGDITVQSKPGEGTTFSISLPLDGSPAAHALS